MRAAGPRQDGDGSAITESDGAAMVDVKVVPRASRDRIGPRIGDRIKVQLCAPPVDGAANEALRALWARELGVPRAAVVIVRGEGSRQKTLRVDGVGRAAIERLLGEGA